jgi:N-methylhydantoinase B/oxoprolinase/acetone carboxylase alpha subunit
MARDHVLFEHDRLQLGLRSKGRPPRVIKTKEVSIPIRPGDVFMVESGAGGGWDDPVKRTREARARDVELGFVSAPGGVRGESSKPDLVTARRKRA